MTEEEKKAAEKELAEIELAEIEALDTSDAKNQEPTPIKDAIGSVVGTGLRALDYAGGLARTSAAGLANIPYSIATGKSLQNTDDVVNALKGNAPSTADIMERGGVPEGAKVDLFPEVKIPFTDVTLGEGETSVRDAAGLVGDIALDPLTYLSGGSTAAAKLLAKYPALKKLIKPASELTEKTGTKIFKSGLKNIDEKVLESGADEFSDLLLKKGASGGTTKQIQKKAAEIEAGIAKQRKILYQVADGGGVAVDPSRALLEAEEQIAKIRTNPTMNDLADKLQNQIDLFKKEGPVPVERMSNWKTDLYNSMPESAFDIHGRLKAPAQKVNKSMASGMKNEIEAASDAAMPGLGKQISKTNSEWQTVLAAKKPMQKQVKSAKKINAWTSVDSGILGTAAFGNPAASVGALAAKKAGDLSKTTLARTTTGNALRKIGQSGAPDIVLRQAVKPMTPWINMKNKDDKK